MPADLLTPTSPPPPSQCRRLSWSYLSTISLSLLGHRGPKVPLTWVLAALTTYLSYVAYHRSTLRRQHRQHQRNLRLYWSKFSDRLRFGFDIGGTLCKLVYFEPHTVIESERELKHRLDAFIKSATHYGVTGNRDEALQFSCQSISGTFHFLKFQTSQMSNFIRIVKENRLSPMTHNNHIATASSNDAPAHSHSDSGSNLRPLGLTRRLSIPPNRITSPALTSSSAAVLSFSIAQSTQSQPGTSAVSGVSGPARVRPKLGATAWYTLTDPASPPFTAIKSPTFNSSLTMPTHSRLSSAPSTAAGNLTDSNASASNGPGVQIETLSLSSLCDLCHRLEAEWWCCHCSIHICTNDLQTHSKATPDHQIMTLAARYTTDTEPNDGCSNRQSSIVNDVTPINRSQSSLISLPLVQSAKQSVLSALTNLRPLLPFLPPPHSLPLSPSPTVCGTGGGAYKFANNFLDELSIDLNVSDELESLVKGIDFMIHSCNDECYILSSFLFKEPLQRQTLAPPIHYPYLVCNIGSGVSILKVSGPQQFERVGGTSLGGGTFLGLCRAIVGSDSECQTFDQAIALAERGHSSKVDLLVGDIYGGDYSQLGLAKENVAASFGKLARLSTQGFSKADLCKAALVMITNNIGSLVNLYAHQVLHVPQMIFVGNFLTHNEIAKRGLAFATDYWSHSTAQAIFLKHEGYFGAVGALLV